MAERSPSRAQRGALGRVEDTAIVDAVQEAQLYLLQGRRLVRFVMFNPGRPRFRKAKPLSGRSRRSTPTITSFTWSKETARWSRTHWRTRPVITCPARALRCSQPPLIDRNVAGFNYDMAEGVDYEIDLTRPEGARVRNLRWHGQPLAASQKLHIAVNNYRQEQGARVIPCSWGPRSCGGAPEEIRDMIVHYYTDKKKLPAEADNHWRVIPDEARRTLEREAQGEAGRPQLQ